MILKSRLFLLGIFLMLAITMMAIVNTTAEANADANAAIKRYDNPPNLPGCGKIHIRAKKVVGGYNAIFGSHPWHGAIIAKIEGRWEYYCGSSLLNDRWMITAAHCQYTERGNLIPIIDLVIRLGDWDLYRDSEELPHEDYDIERREIHPDYSHGILRNDITMLKLDRTVEFQDHISPICLPASNLNVFNRIATVAGWGAISWKPTLLPHILQEVNVRIITNQKCQRWYKRVRKTIYDQNICAGYDEGEQDSCKGDSGGGLTTLVRGRDVLIGVVSWGIPCAHPRLPGVYVRVQYFVPWISKILNL